MMRERSAQGEPAAGEPVKVDPAKGDQAQGLSAGEGSAACRRAADDLAADTPAGTTSVQDGRIGGASASTHAAALAAKNEPADESVKVDPAKGDQAQGLSAGEGSASSKSAADAPAEGSAPAKDRPTKGASAKRRDTRVRKPAAWLYYPLCLLAALLVRLFLRARFDLDAIRGLKGPALILCPHISNLDFILVAAALLPHRPTFVVSEHFLAKPLVGWFLRRMAVIPKKMYSADVRTVRAILRARAQGRIVVLFPEGRLPCVGHSVNLTEGTAQLVKKLGVDVYTITGNGAYLTLPKWGKSGFRLGRIRVEAARLFDGADLGAMPLGAVQAALEAALYHDEDAVARAWQVPFHSPAIAKGLDGVLYRCPVCRQNFTMQTGGDLPGDTIRCTACGFSARLDNRYRLQGGPFSSINQWYLWQLAEIDLEQPLACDADVAAVGPSGLMVKDAGHAHLYMDRELIRVQGTVFGQPVAFSQRTAGLAFPAAVGRHFDLYHEQVLYHFRPLPDPRASFLWVCYLDRLNGNIRDAGASPAHEDSCDRS